MTRIVEGFREGLKKGELRIQTCNACKTHIMYPRHRCISCGSDDLGWTVASGKGVLHAAGDLRCAARSAGDLHGPGGVLARRTDAATRSGADLKAH